MNYNVLERIRRENLRYAIFQFINLLIFNVCGFLLTYDTFTSSLDVGYIFFDVIFLLVTILFDIHYYKIVNLVFFPQNSKLFKKYGCEKKYERF